MVRFGDGQRSGSRRGTRVGAARANVDLSWPGLAQTIAPTAPLVASELVEELFSLRRDDREQGRLVGTIGRRAGARKDDRDRVAIEPGIDDVAILEALLAKLAKQHQGCFAQFFRRPPIGKDPEDEAVFANDGAIVAD